MGGYSREVVQQYDKRCLSEYNTLFSRVSGLFVSIDIGCPYGLPHIATFHQATFAPISERVMELFLSAGYRRNGNCLYDMRCRDCSKCIPIRLHPAEFRPNRNQRRTYKKNADLDIKIVPLLPNEENYDLCERFLAERYPRESNSSLGYYRDFFQNHIVSSARIEYRLHEKLVGASIVDIGYNWLNAVYFYFDPVLSSRSLGTYNILQLVDLCRQWEIGFLYLGYLIESVPAMSYKEKFQPNYQLKNDTWVCSRR